jgi:ADP-ribosylglycohydrolase
MSSPPFSLDKIRGLLIGLAVGDALGALNDGQDTSNYSGYLQGNVNRILRGKGIQTLQAGTITNVTELAIIVARMMLINPSYPWQRDLAIENYLAYANSGTLWLDPEMEKYFKGVRTKKGYEDRFNKDLSLDYNQLPLSNTCLYRSVTLSLIKDNVFAFDDARLTHRDPLVQDANNLMVTALRLAMWGEDSLEDIVEDLKAEAEYPINSEVLKIGETKMVNIASDRTDCYIPLYLLANLKEQNILSFQEAMDYIILTYPKSDLRVNCGLMGAFYGALLGYDALTLEDRTSFNINLVRTLTNPSKNPSYTLVDFDGLCSLLFQAYGQ